MGIALERELEDGEDEEILKTEEDSTDGTKKRKAQDVFGELLDADDIDADLKKEIDELVHEEEDMLNIKNEEEEEDPDIDEKESSVSASLNEKVAAARASTTTPAKEDVIELLDDDDADDKPLTIASIRELYRESGVLAKLKIDPEIQFNNLRVYSLQYDGPTYGLIMVSCNGRVVVKAHQSPPPDNSDPNPKIGSIIVGVNQFLIP